MENPLKKVFDGIFSNIIGMTKLIGLNTFREDYNALEALLLYVDIPIYLVVNFYSVWFFQNDFVRVAIILVPSVYSIQGIMKIYVQLFKLKKLASINAIIIDFYKYITEKYPKYINALKKKLNMCIFVINIMWKIFFSAAILFGISPIFIMIYTKQLQLPFGFVFPMLDYDSHPGFEINYLFHLLQIYCVALGFSFTDALCLLYIYNGCLQVEAIILMLKELDSLLEDPDSNKENIENILNDIIETYQIQRKYMLIIDDVYNMGYMVSIATDMLQNAIVLIVMTMEFWFLGLIFIILATIQIFLVCFLGTYIVIIHENLEHAIYNIKWCSLELKQQKYILLMLLLSQKPTNLSVGGMVMMDLNTFVQIYKTIYSFFMMLQNMEAT